VAPEERSKPRTLLAQVGGWSRFVIIIPVLGLLVGALALVIVGAIDMAQTIGALLGMGGEAPSSKKLLVEFIEIADMFLLAVVLYMMSLGLFELFIDSNLRLPEWLQFKSFDDLKYQLVGVIIAVLAVLFLSRAIEVKVAQDLFWFGGGTAAVIFALSYFLKGSKGGKSG
jgi:uncharacterized membrane protein YqhA